MRKTILQRTANLVIENCGRSKHEPGTLSIKPRHSVFRDYISSAEMTVYLLESQAGNSRVWYLSICLEEVGKLWNASVNTAGTPAETEIWCLRNTMQPRYRLTYLQTLRGVVEGQFIRPVT